MLQGCGDDVCYPPAALGQRLVSVQGTEALKLKLSA